MIKITDIDYMIASNSGENTRIVLKNGRSYSCPHAKNYADALLVIEQNRTAKH